MSSAPYGTLGVMTTRERLYVYCTPELAEKIKASADANHRSANGEMVSRLEASYACEKAGTATVEYIVHPEIEAA